MKNKIFNLVTAFILLLHPHYNYGQSPNLGTAAEFVLFATVGEIPVLPTTHLNGHVGTNSGSSTGFGNVNGVMNDNNGARGQCCRFIISL